MAVNVTNRNFYKDGRNSKRNQESLTDEIALRDEILELKRQVMVLRRANEQNLVKFRKYEDEAKRKDREIEQLMDPRKNADVTKVLSTKGAAILMTLKDQNNALIQMVLNKDVQIRRLLAEMKMSKLYASTRRNAAYREEIARLKNLLVKSKEKLRENLERENQIKSVCAIENSFLEFSSSGQSSPRDLDELQMVIRSLETHIKYTNDLLHKKDQEISVLSDELNFLKKLLQYKTQKNKPFDCHSTDLHKYSANDIYSIPQIRVPDITQQQTKVSSAELLELFQKPPAAENKIQSNSAPASSTRLLSTDESLLKHKSISNIVCSESWKESVKEGNRETKAESTLLHDIAVGDDADGTASFEKARTRKKVLNRHREAKKRIPRKFGGSAKKKKFYENEEKNRNVSLVKTSEPKKEERDGTSEIFKIMDSKETEVDTKTQEICSVTENPEYDDDCGPLQRDAEERNETQADSLNLTINSEVDDMQKEIQTAKDKEKEEEEEEEEEEKGLITDSEGAAETNSLLRVEITEKSRTNDEASKPGNFRNFREIYQQSFDSSFESENDYALRQQAQQVQVEVQIDSITTQNESDNSGSSISGKGYQGQLAEKRGDCPPDDDDDNDVITP